MSRISITGPIGRLKKLFRTAARRDLAEFNAPAIVILTAASAILLAWSASLCLSEVAYRTALKVQRFTIVVSGSVRVPDNGTAVTRLLADGKALRSDNSDLKGTWISYWVGH
jgi:hypothetical protein